MYSTLQRNALMNFFENNPYKLFSAQEIYDALAEHNVSKSAIYRNLSELEKSHKIKKHTKKGSKKTYYQYINSPCCKGKIHLHCLQCDNFFHMNEIEAASIVDSVSQNEEFVVDKSATVLYGICKKCKNLEEINEEN